MRKPAIVSLIALMAAVVLSAQRGTPPGSTSLLIREVTVIDGNGGSPVPNASILIRNGRISEIIPSGASAASADVVVNGHGLYAIPGLIDAHVHLSPSPMDERLDQLRRTLEGGVTGVYDLAGDLRQTSDLARMVIAGDISAPSIYYAALVSGPAFFTDPRVVGSSLGFKPGEAPWAQEINSTTDMVRAVAAARGTGATALKLYAALDAPTVRRIADEGRRQGLRLVAHGTVFPAKPSDLVAAGVNMLAHVAYLVWEGVPPSTDFTKRAVGDFAHVAPDSPEIEKLLASMRERDVALNPTLWIFENGPASRDAAANARTPWMNAVTRRAQELGVPIVAGTDQMFDRAVDRLPILHRELEVEVSAGGLTPMQALASATRNAAHAIGIESSRGTIDKGKIADIVLLEANPIDDIRNTRRIRYVIKDGRLAFDGQAGRSDR